MNIDFFNEFIKYENNGIKIKAKEYVNKFIQSFENYIEKESWVINYLPKLEQKSNGRIRNELFEEIIFPVLWNGYNNKEINLMIWLVKLEQNYLQNNRIWEKMNYKTDMEIIKECYEIEPENNEVVEIYLKLIIEGIDYSMHELPYGILFGNNFATIDECNKLLEEIPFIKKLDKNNMYKEYINKYENEIKKYMEKDK